MQSTQQMLSSNPRRAGSRTDSVAACIDACAECEVVCSACADACLGEQDLEMMRRCIRLDLDCADVCGTTARLLARASEGESQVLQSLLSACMRICVACAQECERHDTDHCRVCAEVCRRCEDACRRLEGSFARAA